MTGELVRNLRAQRALTMFSRFTLFSRIRPRWPCQDYRSWSRRRSLSPSSTRPTA